MNKGERSGVRESGKKWRGRERGKGRLTEIFLSISRTERSSSPAIICFLSFGRRAKRSHTVLSRQYRHPHNISFHFSDLGKEQEREEEKGREGRMVERVKERKRDSQSPSIAPLTGT